jgi:integrase/recombinase XerD
MNNQNIIEHLRLTVKPSTLATYEPIYDRFALDFRRVNAPQIWRYIEKLRGTRGIAGDHLSWRTVRKNLNAISAAIEAAVRLGERKENPVPRILKSLKHKRTPARRETLALSPSEVRRVLDCASTTQHRALMYLLFFTGVRISEALALNVEDIKAEGLKPAFCVLKNTKANCNARQNIPREAVPHIIKLVSQRSLEGATGSDPLFVSIMGERLHRTVAYHIFRHLCGLAGIEPHSPHSSRASFITNLLAIGTPMNQVRHASRHGSVSMVETYENRRLIEGEKIAPSYQITD